jgi:beta-mannosidase
VVRQEDGTRFWHAVSPDYHSGENHNWTVWHGGAPAAAYRADPSACLSEFGLSALPNLASLQKFLPAADQWPPSIGWQQHHGEAAKLQHYATAGTANVKQFTLKDFISATQRAQAHGLQVGIEACRRRKYAVGVVAFWMLSEPWPSLAWSVLDYYRQPKLAWEMLQRSYQPLLISLDYPLLSYQPGDQVTASVWIVNDTMSTWRQAEATIWFAGREIYRQKVSISADGCQQIGQFGFSVSDPSDQAETWLLRLELHNDGTLLATNQYDLRQPNPQTRSGFVGRLRNIVGHWLLR